MRKKKTVQAQPATDGGNGFDWKDPSLYPKPDDLSLTQWRWEFLRRDAEYQKDWKAYKASNHPFRFALEGDPEDECFDMPYYPEEFEDRWGDIWRILRKYGLARLLDPSVANPKHLRFYFVPFGADAQDIPELRKAKIHTIPWKLQYPYLVWVDLSKALEPQTEYYWDLLKREQGIAIQRIKDEIEKNKKKEYKEPQEEQERQEQNKKEKRKKRNWIQDEIDTVFASINPSSEEQLMEQPVCVPAIKAYKPSQKRWPTFLRVLDARGQKTPTPWKIICEQLLQEEKEGLDYDTASGRAKQTHKAAQTMWRKIPIERSLGSPLGMEDARWADSHSVLPPFVVKKALLSDWLELLPPRLNTILLSSLS